MIDAYEIGIELLLQDGVSAGLDEMARELAAVDAAVAATNAGLSELMRAAEGVRGEAAAAIGGVKPPRVTGLVPVDAGQAPRIEERPVVAPSPMGDGGGAAVAVAPVVVGVPAGPTAPTVPAALVEAPAKDLPRVRQADERVARGAVAVAPPVAGASARVPATVARVGVTTAAVAAAPFLVPAVAAIPLVEPAMPSAPRVVTVAAPVAAGRAMVPAGGAAAPAGVPQARRGGEGAAQVGRASIGAPKAGMVMERAAAPRRESVAGAGGGGPVMLDGRLVGQWLTERMARDAARPGAGTTFFDPRQAPAWTPSGAV